MAKQLNVSLAFTADTSQAKQQLQSLQTQLNDIIKAPSKKLGVTENIQQAISAATELSVRLQEATNVKTGNLDFSKFNNSLKQSGQSLQSYGQQLQKLGPAGQQAFVTLTKSIATAEIPIKRTNTLVKEFTTTLANTARWQISSSVLHGFMGAIQSAYGYAQDLNESLNNIRIVTGQTTDQMAKFAAEANAAAKALSSTTTEYTNASLIYYQQGLNDQQVKERTDVTIKMANVARQSAEVVSDQMTAVWNNFYDGSKSLEYYADVMTALGAATASSTEEIAGGLEKFAAIGNTIGLSYEYAASALATITSNTRQSEEVVGTALKTIFARIQGLNLGETLDDGTSLNKYSQALEKVGISIFEQNGEIKKMDNILDEMAAKWGTLAKDQQIALAQTVAGVRQYTQLVALMDNWDKGDSDSMKANLTTSYGATGTLDEQADIYAESWEAARDRVQAAAEEIYGALLNDDFFIELLNGFEDVLEFISRIIDNLGGLRGVLLTLGAIVTKVFSNQIAQGLSNMAYNLKMMTKKGREEVETERRNFIDNAVNSIPQSNEYTTNVEKAQQDSLRTELTLQSEYMANAERMSAIEAETNKKLIERTRLLKEQTVELARQKEAVDTRVSDKVMDLRGDVGLYNKNNPDAPIDYDEQVGKEINRIKQSVNITPILKEMQNASGETFKALKADLASVNVADLDNDIKQMIRTIIQMGDDPSLEELKAEIDQLNLALDETVKGSRDAVKDVVSPEAGKKVDALTQDLREQAQVERDLATAKRDGAKAQETASQSIANARGAQKQWSDVLVESANVAFNVASALSMVSSAIDTLKDPDVSGMQKLTTVLMTLGMVLPTIVSLIGTMKKLFSSETVAKIANAAATWAQVAAEKKLNDTKGQGSGITRRNIKETWKDTKNKLQGKGKNLKDSWNKGALDKDTRFTKMDDGRYSFKGSKQTFSADVAGKKAGGDALKALGSKAASAAIAAIGIAVIIGTVAAVVNQLNKAEKAVEKAKQAAQSLTENYDKVKESYDAFNTAQSNYDTATEGLSNLTKGTVEYQEALLAANDAAAELIATNKNLDYTIQDGQMVIDPDSLEDVKKKQLENLEYAQAAKMAGQRELDEAEMNLKKRDAARNLKSGSDGWQKAGNSAAGGILAAAGAGLAAGGIAGAVGGGGVFSIPAAIIGAVIGGVAGIITGIVQETSTNTEQEAFDTLAKAVESDETLLARIKAGEVSEEEFRELGIQDEGLIASLQANGEAVAELVGEMQANTAAINAQNDLVASQVLGDNEAVQKSEYRDQIIDIAGDAYGQAYDKAMESDWVDSWGKDGISKANGANKEAKKVFEEYLKYAGLEGQGYELTDTTGTDKNRKFVYKDASGEEHTVSLEAMQAARAAYEASNTLDDAATKLAQTFDKLADSSNSADQALLSFVSQKNFEGASKGEFEDIQNEIGDIGYNEETGEYDQSKVQSYLESSLGETLTDDVAIRYGYESADAMMDAFAKQLSNAETAWDSIKVPDNFKFAKDMSLGTAKALESQIEEMNLGPLGEKAGEEYVNGLNKMLEGMDSKDQQAALSELTAIDWSDWDAMERAEAILSSYGKEIDSASTEWADFTHMMRIANLAQPDFSKIKNDLNDICGILDKLDFGSVISEEDYQRLVEYNDEWERFFMLQADGSRKFIGDSAAMRQETRDNIAEQKRIMQERQQAQSEMESAGWGVGSGADREKLDWYRAGEQFDYASTAQNLVNTSDTSGTGKVLATLGYTDQVITQMITDYNNAVASGDEQAIKAAEERFKAMYNGIGDFMGEDFEANQQELDEMMASTATSIEELNSLWENGSVVTEEAYDKQLNVLAMQATSLEELQRIQASSLNGETGLDTYEYGQALLNLAENYENCAKEAEEYSKALLTGDKATIEAAQSALEAAVEIGELAEKYDLNSEELEDYAKRLKELHKNSNISLKDATKLAVANMRLDRGMSNLNDNLKDYKKALSETNRGSAEWSSTLSELKTDLADMFNIADGSMLSDKFAEATLNSNDLKLALDGNVDALLRLRLAAADDIIANLEIDDSALANVQTQWANVKSIIENNDINAPGFNQAALIDSFNEMIRAGQMTKEQIEAAFAGLNISANVHTEYIQQDTQVPTTITDEYLEMRGRQTYVVGYNPSDGTPITADLPMYRRYTQTYSGEPVTVSGWVPQYSIEGTEGPGGITTGITQLPKPTASRSSTTSGKQSSSGGGSSSKPKTSSAPSKMDKKDNTHSSETVKRYKEIDDQLDDLADSYERANREADKLFGVDKLEAIEKENELLQEQQKLIEKKAKEAKKYMAIDKAELDEVAKEAGLNFSYDENGNITNYTDQMTNLHNQLAAAENEYNRMVDEYNAAVDAAVAQYGDELPEELANQLETKQKAIEAYEENVLSKVRDTITSVEEAMELYEESKELYEELGLEAEDIANQIKENNYRIISEGLELRITLNEDDLELIEYQLGKLEEDFYNMAESIAIMVGSGTANLGGDGTQLGEYIDNLNHYKNTMEELERAYAAGEITEASYVEGMKEVRSGMLENLHSIQELDDAMMNYYEETLAAGQEELDKYTSKMEHQTAVLEHYMSVMEILGKSQDYESLGVILEAQAKSIGNEAKVAKENYEMLQSQADAKKAAYEAASTPEEAELLKKEWEAAQIAANEAQDEMLSKTEEWAEAMTAVAQNKLKGLGQALEDALTAGFGGSFDAMTTAMERANSLQEEYLTTTNQIYETNKLMHTAQKEIEKTSNDVAKRKMKDFIIETKQLQDQTKLSKYELDIQKAKYDLLLAEIALEEAQSAKSTVRLQRDSEGNFGYVYTADKTAVDNAQQAFEDAQNNLYNIGLEGTNNYTQKYQETLNEFYDTMTSLQEQYLNGEFQNEEEYQAAMQSAREFYYAKLQEYSSLNSVALSTDARVVEDAWTKEFRGMTQQTDLWMQNVDGYVRNVMGVFDEWQTQMAEVRKTTVGPDLVALKENTQEIVEASDALAEAVTKDGGVIDALEKEYNAVSKITGAYAQYRDIIADLIAQYDGFMGRINTTVNTAAGTGNSSPTPGPEGFASGGYTGEWGPGGKLAMLHQKELILKEGDTENFLASLEVLRDIVKVIDLHAMNAQFGGLLNSPQYHDYEGTREVLEQQVHIEASFPNVSDRHEIEEALTTLVNKASQFTGRL